MIPPCNFERPSAPPTCYVETGCASSVFHSEMNKDVKEKVLNYAGLYFADQEFEELTKELQIASRPLKIIFTKSCITDAQQKKLACLVNGAPGLKIVDTEGNPLGPIYMDWSSYYAELDQAHPHGDFELKLTVSTALEYILEELKSPPECVVDYGAGIGDDTIPLIVKGGCKDVLAIDTELAALETLKKNLPEGFHGYVKTAASFKDHQLEGKVDLLVSSYTLPYLLPENFSDFWKFCTNMLKSGGYFAGHFFGPVTGKQDPFMTFHSKDEVLSLFEDFEIKLLKIEPEGTDFKIYGGTGSPPWGDLYHVVAKKK